MPLSRRKFLAAGAAGAAAALGAVLFRDDLAHLYRKLDGRVLERLPPGPLSDDEAAALGAAVEPLMGLTVEVSHYVDYFRWRAEHIPLRRSVYQHFVRSVDAAARESGAASFTDADVATRRRLLDEVLPKGKLVVGDVQISFDSVIVQEVRTVFAATDAWVHLGYDSWPGQSRTLEHYTQAPRNG